MRSQKVATFCFLFTFPPTHGSQTKNRRKVVQWGQLNMEQQNHVQTHIYQNEYYSNSLVVSQLKQFCRYFSLKYIIHDSQQIYWWISKDHWWEANSFCCKTFNILAGKAKVCKHENLIPNWIENNIIWKSLNHDLNYWYQQPLITRTIGKLICFPCPAEAEVCNCQQKLKCVTLKLPKLCNCKTALLINNSQDTMLF